MATVMLVHGAFHGPWCWDPVRVGLEARGVTVVAPELPFTGLDDDAGVVADALDALAARDEPVVLCGHSYGGMVISHAASGRDDVAQLVYLCAVQVDDPEELGAITRHTPLMDALRVEGEGMSVDPALAADCFYNDCDPEVAAAAVASLRPMDARPAAPAASPVAPAWRTLPSTYVVCTLDRTLDPETQRAMARHAGTVVEWETGHSPMLSRPELVVDLLEGLTTA